MNRPTIDSIPLSAGFLPDITPPKSTSLSPLYALKITDHTP